MFDKRSIENTNSTQFLSLHKIKQFLQIANIFSQNSKDPSTKVGCVLVKDGVLYAAAYNGFARGINDSEERLMNRETKLDFTIHAEENSLLNANRLGIDVRGSDAFVTRYPCFRCSMRLANAGINTIYYIKNQQFEDRWKDPRTEEIIAKEAGINIIGVDIDS